MFLHGFGLVRLDGLHTQFQPGRNVRVAVSPGDQAQDFVFAGAQTRPRPGPPLRRRPSRLRGTGVTYGRIDIRAARPDGPDGRQQFRGTALFQDVAGYAGAEQLPDVSIVRVARQREDLQAGLDVAQGLGGLESVEPWHGHIHHDHVRSAKVGLLDGIPSVSRFAHHFHNVLKDPPFSQVDLVSCRNLLIYLNPDAQRRVVEVAHFGLRPQGYLFLGASESVDHSGLFVAVDRAARIFQARGAPRPGALLTNPRSVARTGQPPGVERQADGAARERYSFGDTHLRLLEQYAAPSVLVNEDYDIVHVSEHAGRFLRFPGGAPPHDLLRAVRPELRVPLRTALHRATKERTAFRMGPFPVPLSGGEAHVTLAVRPVLSNDDPARGVILVLFEAAGAHTADDVDLPSLPSADASTAQLEEELSRARAQLRGTVEQHATQAEELKASNEELQAINEELRATAEELETSKQELQSVNEELSAVNEELKGTIVEQTQAANDLQNLINSTDIGTLFLDRQSQINFFTPRARDIFSLIPSDRGRPLSDISSRLVGVDIAADVDRVLQELQRVEREVQTLDGRWHVLRLLPYRTSEDRIDGVVLTFLDITERRQNLERLRLSEERYRSLVLATATTVWRTSADGARLLDVEGEQVRLPAHVSDERPGEWLATIIPAEERDEILARWGEAVARRAFFDAEHRMIAADGTLRYVHSRAVPLVDPHGEIREWIGASTDISERRRMEDDLRQSEERLRLTLESLTDFAIFTTDVENRIETWNAGAARMFGYAPADAVGLPASIIFSAEDRERGLPEDEVRRARDEGRAADERWHVRKDGSRFFASGVLVPLTERGQLRGFAKIARDLTERKRWEEALTRAHTELEARVEE